MTDKQLRFGVAVAILAAILAFIAAADEPKARREWPAGNRDLIALEALNAKGAALQDQKKKLDQEIEAHRVLYEATIAEIRSSCSGLQAREELRYDPSKRVFYVEPAPTSASPAPAGLKK